ncbi:conserved hypothetical protein [Streptomyces sp. SPB074]|nr:conserved hypothetical protein [Streptomyces sp. SPB074]
MVEDGARALVVVRLVVTARVGLRPGPGPVHDPQRAGHVRRVRGQYVGEHDVLGGPAALVARRDAVREDVPDVQRPLRHGGLGQLDAGRGAEEDAVEEVPDAPVAPGGGDGAEREAGEDLARRDGVRAGVAAPGGVPVGEPALLDGGVDRPDVERHRVAALPPPVEEPPVERGAGGGRQVLVERGDLVGVEFGELLPVDGRDAVEAGVPDLHHVVGGGRAPPRHVRAGLRLRGVRQDLVPADDGHLETAVDEADAERGGRRGHGAPPSLRRPGRHGAALQRAGTGPYSALRKRWPTLVARFRPRFPGAGAGRPPRPAPRTPREAPRPREAAPVLTGNSHSRPPGRGNVRAGG